MLCSFSNTISTIPLKLELGVVWFFVVLVWFISSPSSTNGMQY